VHEGPMVLDRPCLVLLNRPRPVIRYLSMGQFIRIRRIRRLALLSLRRRLAGAEYPCHAIRVTVAVNAVTGLANVQESSRTVPIVSRLRPRQLPLTIQNRASTGRVLQSMPSFEQAPTKTGRSKDRSRLDRPTLSAPVTHIQN
jgi:hypothetical protein